jgi:serine/threonine-protein kinase
MRVIEPSPVNPGDVLAGKYRVERVLGIGGMGVVVAATHLELGQQVALKFLLPAAELNGEATARFIREARAAVRISSEHVARVSDVGRLENGAPYMVMEYLDGVDLGAHVKGTLLPIDTAVDFVLQACEAIAVAHALGIVHRDLKPANLFVTIRPDGVPLIKVLDFGISKLIAISEQQPSLTKSSAVMGSPLYMSPEQMRSARNVDVRADVWALGTILHELIAGAPPFAGESLGEVVAAVMTEDAKPLRSLRPDTPERLERLVLRTLEKDPARRVANVSELAIGLAEFAPARSQALVARVQGVLERAGVPSSMPPPPDSITKLSEPHEPPVGVSATDTSWGDQAARGARSSRRSIAFMALGALLLVSIGSALVRATSSASPVASAASTASTSAFQPAPASLTAQVPAVVPAPIEVVPASPSPAESAPQIMSAAPPHPQSAVVQRAVTALAAAPPALSAIAAKPRNPLRIDFK